MDSISTKQSYLSSLAFLHSEIQGRRITAEFLAKGGEITVLIDSSLVISGLRPHIDGPAGQDVVEGKGRGFGQLLPRLPFDEIQNVRWKEGKPPSVIALRRSEDIQAWHVASALIAKVYEIARGGGGKQKIYQFSSHHKETSDILRIIEKKYHDHRRASVTEQEKNHLEATRRAFRRQTAALAIHHFMTEGADIEGVAEIVMSRGEQAMMTWSGGISTLEREYEALGKLKAAGLPECFSIDQFLGGQLATDKFDAEFIEVETHARAIMGRLFHDRLSRLKGSEISLGTQREADLEALVDLASYNKRLIEKSIKHRVVFATIDRKLVLSAYAISDSAIRSGVRTYCLSAVGRGDLDSEQARSLGEQLTAYFGLENRDGRRWFQNFAGHYLRHLWAVSEDALIEPISTEVDEAGEGAIGRFLNPDMFNGLYAKASSRTKVSRRGIEELFTTNSFLDEKALREFDVCRTYIHWNHLIRERVKTWRIKNLGFENLGDEDPTLRSIAQLFPKMVYVLLEEFSNRNRDRAIANLSDTGALDMISQLAKERKRGRPVDLHFLTLNNTNMIFRNVAKKTYYRESPEKFTKEFKAINLDCYGDSRGPDEVFDDRQRSHLKLLVLAAIFAAMEKWSAAKDHARRAIDIIKRSKGENSFFGRIPTKDKLSNMSGREAWYMDSVCHRMLAESDSDFEQAESSLCAALLALNEDIANNESLNKDFHLIRLANERLSQAIARYYFKRAFARTTEVLKVSEYWDELTAVFGFLTDFEVRQEKRQVSLTDLVAYLSRHFDSRHVLDDTRLTMDAIALNLVEMAMVRCFWLDREVEELPILTNLDLNAASQLALRWLTSRAQEGDYIESFLVKLYRVGLPTVDSSVLGEKFDNEMQVDEALAFVGPADRMSESRVAYDIWRIDSLRLFIKRKLPSSN